MITFRGCDFYLGLHKSIQLKCADGEDYNRCSICEYRHCLVCRIMRVKPRFKGIRFREKCELPRRQINRSILVEKYCASFHTFLSVPVDGQFIETKVTIAEIVGTFTIIILKNLGVYLRPPFREFNFLRSEDIGGCEKCGNCR